MRGLSRQIDIRHAGRIAACAAVLAAAGAGGLAAGFTVKHFGAGDSRGVVADIAPSDTVNLRFPADWTEPEGVAPPPRTLAFASADGTFTLFNPQPIMPIPETPIRAEASEPPAQAKPAVAAASVAPTRMALASATSKPVVLPAATAQPVTPPPAAARPAPVHRSSAVLNESQLASIKRRLNLTPDQERYWPAVAAELRKMEYKKDKSAQGSRMASIDMSKVNVDGLKSAGFPLVMSFNDDQRRELKSLTHLLGLESVISGF